MKLHPFAAVTVLLLAISALSQTAPPLPSQTNGDLTVVAQINNHLNSKKLKVGDHVSARVIQDVVAGGSILVPRDAKLFGRVVEVASPTGNDPRSRLAFVFDREEAKKRGSSHIYGVIQAIAPPLNNPFLESAMASSSAAYGGGENGHPVNGGMSSGQSNASTPMITSGRAMTGAEAMQQRERALDRAREHPQEATLPGGALSAQSHGVFGFRGLFLAGSAKLPAIIAVGQNVELKSGTQIVLRLTGGLRSPLN